MSDQPKFNPALAAALLIALARNNGRSGEISLEELLANPPRCGHEKRADRLEEGLRDVMRQIERRITALRAQDGRVLMAQEDWLAELLAFADQFTAPRNEAKPGDVVTADDGSPQAAHQAMADSARDLEPGEARVQAGVNVKASPVVSATEHQALGELADGLGKAAATMLENLNEHLPKGFIAHVSIQPTRE